MRFVSIATNILLFSSTSDFNMSDPSYLTLCPHCNCYLPARTFRNHREVYYSPDSHTWQKGRADDGDQGGTLFMEVPHSDINDCQTSFMDILTSGGSDSECEAPFMEIASDNDNRDDINKDNSVSVHDVIDNEIWDDASIGDVEDDFPQNRVNGDESLPGVDVNVNSRCRALNVLLSRCLVVLLAYFWTHFHISDNGMVFCFPL